MMALKIGKLETFGLHPLSEGLEISPVGLDAARAQVSFDDEVGKVLLNFVLHLQTRTFLCRIFYNLRWAILVDEMCQDLDALALEENGGITGGMSRLSESVQGARD